jgi:DNA-binding beta-propeller fold protein YncE
MFRRMAYSGVSGKAPEFPHNFIWLNTDRPLTLDNLAGQIVVLDFWTYCCINCMHMLPELEWIEKKYYGKPVTVIGVHSAKYSNEQNIDNIKEAIGRYEISHPVIVDEDMKVWRSFDVSGWPTVVIIDPKGNIIYEQSGEGQREYIDDAIQVLLDKYQRQGTLATPPLRTMQSPPTGRRPRATLSYPGKLDFSADKKMIAISDSNHNRILIADADTGKVIHTIGGEERGFKDGLFDKAKFFRPQGISWAGDNNRIYVADTENHALREINIESKIVSTLAGNGKQGTWIASMQNGTETSLSSPWDIAYSNGFILIAMAGLHQIWAYNTQSGKIGPFAGSGSEDIVDGMLDQSQFAQPSGLSIFKNYLFVADSEVSAIRRIDLNRKVVETIVGKGLFEFGHKDGSIDEALLQHPLGVCTEGNDIYVADTYNHSIRLIDLVQQRVTTLVGGKPEMKAVCNIHDPSCDTLGLFEPSDVKLRNRNLLYVADTNNHLIRIFDLGKKVLRTLDIN